MKTTTEFKITDVEDGYAVVRRANGRRIGEVCREKSGSGRTSFEWFAFSGKNQVDRGYTRAEAVAKLIAYTEEKEREREAFLAR
jgi:hypothetical protein